VYTKNWRGDKFEIQRKSNLEEAVRKITKKFNSLLNPLDKEIKEFKYLERHYLAALKEINADLAHANNQKHLQIKK